MPVRCVIRRATHSDSPVLVSVFLAHEGDSIERELLRKTAQVGVASAVRGLAGGAQPVVEPSAGRREPGSR